MRTTVLAAAMLALCGMVSAAQAATVNGFFYVTAVNALNQTSAQSAATDANAQGAFNNAYDGVAGFAYDEFEYEGDLDFSTDNGSNTTIAEWLASGVNGTVTNLDPSFGALQLSKGDIDDGTATTTFFVFVQNVPTGRARLTFTHADGFALYEVGAFDAEEIGGFPGPDGILTTRVPPFGPGIMEILYVATNSDPSVLKVETSPIPLPAGFPLMMAGLVGLGVLRLRRKTV